MNVTSSPTDALEEFNARKIREYAPAIAYSALVIVLGVVGNAFSVAYYGFQVSRTSTNVIITALGTADLIACIAFSDEIIELCLTVTFTDVAGCKFMYFCNHTLVILSSCILVFVALDRYRRICSPFAWQLSVKWARIVLACIVVFSILHSVRDLVILDVVHVNVTDPQTDKIIEAFYCTHTRQQDMKKVVAGFHTMDFVTFIFVIGSCIVLYSLIARALWISNKHIEKTGLGTDHAPNMHREETSISHVDFSQSNVEPASGQDTSDISFSAGIEHRTETLTGGVSSETRSQEAAGKNEQQSMVDGLNIENNRLDTTEQHIDKSSEHHVTFQDETIHTASHASGMKTKRKCKTERHAHAHVERKVSMMMLAITVASIVSFIPYFVVNLSMKVRLIMR